MNAEFPGVFLAFIPCPGILILLPLCARIGRCDFCFSFSQGFDLNSLDFTVEGSCSFFWGLKSAPFFTLKTVVLGNETVPGLKHTGEIVLDITMFCGMISTDEPVVLNKNQLHFYHMKENWLVFSLSPIQTRRFLHSATRFCRPGFRSPVFPSPVCKIRGWTSSRSTSNHGTFRNQISFGLCFSHSATTMENICHNVSFFNWNTFHRRTCWIDRLLSCIICSNSYPSVIEHIFCMMFSRFSVASSNSFYFL